MTGDGPDGDGPSSDGPDGDSLISGRYRLGELLGTGGSASVFAAVDIRDNSEIALKLLHPHLSADPQARDALFREARAASGLRHPNIVAVLDVGVHGGAHLTGTDAQAWIALERAPGLSLTEYVELHGVLGSLQTVALAAGVLRGLEAAHAAGLVHRDISPANIMVAPGPDSLLRADDVRLVDFGLADATGRPALSAAVGEGEGSTPAGALGSVNFVSPEQASGAPVDARGDIYQLGAVLYFALTGRPPFPRDAPSETIRAHLTSPPPVPSVAQPRIPRAVDRLVVKAMLKSPADRYQSAAEMLLAVDALTLGQAAAENRTLLLPAARVSNSERKPRLAPSTAPSTATITTPTSVVVPAPPAEAQPAPDDGSWIWKSLVAVVVVVAVVAWVVSSATGGSGPEAAPAPTTSTAAVVATPTAPVVTAPPAVETTAMVPSVAGSSITDARLAIEAAGFVAGEITDENSATAVGTVLRSSPEQGTSQELGSVVALVVASGLGTVPDVAGLGRDAAIAAIQTAGFAVLMAVREDAAAMRGAILGTDPPAGTAVLLGRPVTILVATLPAATTPTPTPTPTSTVVPGG